MRNGIVRRPISHDVAGRPHGSWWGKLLTWRVLVAVLILAALREIPALLQKWLWMRQLNYAGIFWTLLVVKWGMACVAFIGAFLFLWINLRQAARQSFALADYDSAKNAASFEQMSLFEIRGIPISRRGLTRFIVLIVAALFALFFYGQWDTYLRFRYGDSFGLTDPVFGHDVGFYLFRLPFYRLLESSLVFLTVLAIVGVAGPIRVRRPAGSERRSTQSNPCGTPFRIFPSCFSSWPPLFGWGYYLDRYELDVLHPGRGLWSRLYGGPCDAARLLGHDRASRQRLARLLVLNVFRPRGRALAIGVAAYVGLYILCVGLVPALFQKFVVQPSELKLETPYLKSYIEFTRKAYNLDAIQETAYPALEDLTPEAIAKNQGTIQNIRLWDSRPLLETYQQTQALRLYYQFSHVDTDRYHLADGYHQVMLATRELSPELPAQAQTWVNENLQFTHGYGVVMNFVSKITPGGFPEFVIENVPPESSTRPDRHSAGHLFRGGDARLQDRRDRRQGIRLPQGQSECLHQLWRKRRNSDRQPRQAALVRLDASRH